MKQEHLRQLFADNIKKYLKRAKLKQLYLASLLGVTSSAICQMLKCRIMMSRTQLHDICKALKLSSDETIEMQTLLANLREGDFLLRTPFNKFMKSCRRDRNMSIAKVAGLSGISRIRLKAFEEDFNISFTIDDAEKLSTVYDCSPEFLMKKYDHNYPGMNYSAEATDRGDILEVADARSSRYPSSKCVHMVPFADFVNFEANADLFVFSDVRGKEVISCDIEKPVVAIYGNTAELGIAFDGEITLFVTDKKPLVYVCRVFLCQDKERKLHLLKKYEDNEEFYLCDNSETPFKGKIRWALGVLEMKIAPKLLV